MDMKQNTTNTRRKAYFNIRKFFIMFFVWLGCAILTSLPLFLRPMFQDHMSALDLNYWLTIFNNNDVLYLVAAISTLGVGLTIVCGEHSTAAVYIIAGLEVVAVFMGIMGYLMLEGDPNVFGENIIEINKWLLIASLCLNFILFVTVNIGTRESEKSNK